MSSTGDGETRWLGRQEMAAWRTYIVGSALLEHRLSRELQAVHGLSLADYEILVRLSEHPDRQLRMSRLAEDVAHSKSRISHQIRRLESKGLVQRGECSEDARGVLALLTEEGAHLLEQAAPTHVAGVREHMVDLLTPGEQQMLSEVFQRVTAHLRSKED
ncbi:MarR family winged helix-turn-helix transcriptional regulator [Haloactinomyces albus]|uniref:DNA-binding MarR family transcriptional regulator n=1 Tax=Haloactinomyces albus TaxID=1352928 RepID=A0AAE3ZBG3_9ACTN|nr:MarR family transcriptional regulator [Haloactinomyces albus]MDR7301836.1 DNA-binding MarR family transcriptional regulator [Haloactinomyces albus]